MKTRMPVYCIALMSTVLASSTFADKLVVGTGGLDSIQSAVDAAIANADETDTILIPSGTYQESVVVDYGSSGQTELIIKRKGKGTVLIEGQGIGAAVQINNARHVRLEQVTVKSADTLDTVAAVILTGVTHDVRLTGVNGVAGDDFGVQVIGSLGLGARFHDCDFSGMQGVGFIIDGCGHELSDCRADGCGLNGAILSALALNCRIVGGSYVAAGGSAPGNAGVITLRGNGHFLDGVTVGGGGLDGILVDGGGHSVRNCTSSDNVRAGFNTDSAQLCLQDCKATGNTYGLLGGGLGATIDGGTYSNNAGNGIRITEGGTNLTSVTAKGNGSHGIYLTIDAVGTSVRSCSVRQNGGEGVVVEGQLTWLEANTAKSDDGFVDQGANNCGRNNKVAAGVNDF